jgi:2,5-diamino-6-(ribosylamino)-4(3H)-pyrimidinone 5'-phosphate reductase
VRYFSALSDKFVLITSNKNHPAFSVKEENVSVIYQEKSSLSDALELLKTQHGCERITLQSGGTLNALLLREKLIDFVDIVIAPILVGGRDTSTIVDGESLTLEEELSKIGVLELLECKLLENSYVRLKYKVVK